MPNFSTLIGGIAGDGINEAGMTVGRLFAQLGYRIYMYYDYPSLIRGGHNFSIVRASDREAGCHFDKVDILIAMNQETVDLHKWRLKDGSIVVYDSERVRSEGIIQMSFGIAVSTILKEEQAPPIMRNTCIIGSFSRLVGIDWTLLEGVLKKHIPKQLPLNLKVARRGYYSASEMMKVERVGEPGLPLPLLTGNQAIGLGLVKAGLEAYVAYPMTPASSLLDFMARYAPDFGLKVVHPENEIAVILMAQGFAYAGAKTAVGTSGGGFCLMTEGISLAGLAEMPVVVMVGQRTGPSTGLPTYTAQGDLHFILNAGQGEFPRFVVSPGDAQEAYFWSGAALNTAWKYQIPAFILSDKTVCEGLYSFDLAASGDLKEEAAKLWDGSMAYSRYSYTESGVSPLAYPPDKGQAIKVNSYVHDELGITTEDADITRRMNDKRLQKGESLAKEMEGYETVKVYGSGKTALLCWGSNKGVCIEAAENSGLKVIHILVLAPFPIRRLQEALNGVERLVAVECNSTGQLSRLARYHGISSDQQILKYDGRPFSLDDLESEIKRVAA